MTNNQTSTKFQQLASAVERSRQGLGTAEDTLLLLRHQELAQLMARFKTPSKPDKKA